MNQLDKNASVKDVQATLTWARSQGVSKAGVLGYCMGGYIAFLAACRTDTDATVCYHGGGIHTALGEASAIKKPVMLHNPMKDGFIPRRGAQHHPRDAEEQSARHRVRVRRARSRVHARRRRALR